MLLTLLCIDRFTGALAVSTSLVVMELFGASHPPGGALALFFVSK